MEQPLYDHAYIEVSDDGSSWAPVWANGAGVEDSAWSEVSYDISGTADGQATVYIRFEIGGSDGSWQYSGWNIDDLRLEATISGGTNDNCLNWTLSSDDGGGQNDVDHYNIYRADNSGGPWDAGAYIDNVAAGIDTYTDLGRGEFDGTNWWYVVRAVDIATNEDTNSNAVPEISGGNNPPNAPFNPVPADTATGIATSPTLSVDVSDPDGDTMDVDFYDASDDSLIGGDNNVANGGTASVSWNGLSESTTYSWYAIADDGEFTTQSATWSFTTLDSTAPASPTGLTVEHYGSGGVPIVESYTSGTTAGALDTTVSLDMPAGLVAGDLILAIFSDENANANDCPVIAVPDAYTQITHGANSGDVQAAIYWRIATGSETWPLVIQGTGANDYAVGWCLRISGADQTTPIHQTGVWVGVGLTGAGTTIPQVTTTVDNCLGIFMVGFDGADLAPSTITAGPGWSITDGLEDPVDNTGGAAADWGQKNIASSGASDDIVLSFGGTDGYVGIQIAIQPAAGGGLDDNAVNWTRSADDGAGADDVDYYNIYRSDVNTGPWDGAHIIDTVPATGAASYSYIDLLRGQADATLWWYIVRAVDLSTNEDTNSIAVQEPGFVLPTAYDIDVSGASIGDWVFVSYAIDISGPIEIILDDTVYGGGGTDWDVAKWYDVSDPVDPWKTHRKGASTNDLINIDNTMGVWLHLTANDGTLTTGLTGDYSAGAVNINLYTGWNLVSYPSATNRLASTTLPGVANMVAYYDDAAPYLITDAVPGAVTFIEGNAYWVRVTADTVWSVDP